MAWHEDETVAREGFDISSMTAALTVWLPITFQTGSSHPPAQDKFYAVLTPDQRSKLSTPSETVLAAEHTLTAANRDTLRDVLNLDTSFGFGFFRAGLGPSMKMILPAGWVAIAASLTVKTLVGYLLNVEKTKESATYLSANLATGGSLRELWHVVDVGPGKTYFYRDIQYEVQIGAERRQFVLLSWRYALAP
ncbi:hypothetical protein [Cupriavidus sp. CP313]